MKPPPPRRNYQQMVRVVRDSGSSPKASAQHNNSSHVPYKLAKAYGAEARSATETRERSLDEIGVSPRTSRRPEPPAAESYLPQRESTTLYHQLNRDQQQYFTGSNPNPVPTRQDGWPGTKSRAYLGDNGHAEQVLTTPPQNPTRSQAETGNKTNQDPSRSPSSPTQQQASGGFSPMNHNPPMVKKQTRLPAVDKPSLEGTKGSDVSFDL